MSAVPPRPPAYDPAHTFKAHECDAHQLAGMSAVRGACKVTAQVVLNVTPASREQSLALTKLEEAMFWANAAIARNP